MTQQATEHWRQYVTSDTLQAADLKGRRGFVMIERVVPASMTDRQDPKKSKGVLNVYFKGVRKPLVCKAELCGVISKVIGTTKTKEWVGAAVEIYPTTVYAFGANHEVVRISPKRPSADEAKRAGARAPEPEPPENTMAEDEIREAGTEDPSPEEIEDILRREREENA